MIAKSYPYEQLQYKHAYRKEIVLFTIKNVRVADMLQIDHLEIKEDVTCIVGQSGSGKSTLLRLLNNLDDPTAGEILFNGENIINIAPRKLRKKIVMLPQTPVSFDGTIRDNLLIGLEFSGEKPATDEQLEEILQVLSLHKDLETDIYDLSGGERQRVSLGRVLLMKDVEAYLLDEPSSELDDETAKHVLANFIDFTKENNRQLIMVTHDQKVRERFADETITMDQYSKVVSG